MDPEPTVYRNFTVEAINTERRTIYIIYTENGDRIGPTGYTTVELAKAWIDGYLHGLEHGKTHGRIEIQYELSRLLNLQMKAPE